VNAELHSRGHEVMVGGVEVDCVGPIPVPVVSVQGRWDLVGQASGEQHLFATESFPEGLQALLRLLRQSQALEEGVDSPKAEVGKQRGLIKDLMSGFQDTSRFSNLWARPGAVYFTVYSEYP